MLRASLCRVAVASSLAVLLLAAASIFAPVMAAPLTDPCGPQPDWWDAVNWLSWESCEVSNGLASAPSLTEIVSPILNDISTGISNTTGAVVGIGSDITGAIGGMESAVVSAVNGVASGVVSGLVAYVVPSADVWTPLQSQLTLIRTTREPFASVYELQSALGSIQAAYSSAAGALSVAPAAFPGGPTGPIAAGGPPAPAAPSGTAFAPSSGDYGSASGGVAWFIWALGAIGISDQVIRALVDFSLFTVAMFAVLHDIGVGVGAMWGDMTR
jgi:hypothetical protein